MRVEIIKKVKCPKSGSTIKLERCRNCDEHVMVDVGGVVCNYKEE